MFIYLFLLVFSLIGCIMDEAVSAVDTVSMNGAVGVASVVGAVSMSTHHSKQGETLCRFGN